LRLAGYANALDGSLFRWAALSATERTISRHSDTVVRVAVA
jgi:hypothetical protein